MTTLAFDTGISDFTIRFAAEDDIPTILAFIQGLADYERLRHECIATEEVLRSTLFGPRAYAEVLIGSHRDEPTCFALFFHTYSTFLARPGIYLEDLFVIPEWRGRGMGGAILRALARIAVDRECGRLEWAVLDWNVDAVRFYERLGAVALDDWTTMRVAGAALLELGGTQDA